VIPAYRPRTCSGVHRGAGGGSICSPRKRDILKEPRQEEARFPFQKIPRKKERTQGRLKSEVVFYEKRGWEEETLEYICVLWGGVLRMEAFHYLIKKSP